jgi:hypothetical protein
MAPRRTIGDLEAAGFTHIEARCGCTTTMLPFLLLKRDSRITDATTVADLVARLRCKRCGAPPASTRPWRRDIDDTGVRGNPAAHWGMMPPRPGHAAEN